KRWYCPTSPVVPPPESCRRSTPHMALEQEIKINPTSSRPLGTIVVTGAASGLGAAIAAAISAHGGTAIALDRVAPADPRMASVCVDLSDTQATQRAVQRLASRGIDAVVTAAGIDVPGGLTHLSAEQWEHVVRVNLFGTVAVIRAALPSLIE